MKDLSLRARCPLLVGTIALLLAACLGGCASDPTEELPISYDPDVAPRISSFLSSPAVVLLTNEVGYSAQFELESGSISNSVRKITGNIFVRGGKVLMVPSPKWNGGRKMAERGYELGFVWDTSVREGFAMSEALQGYATLTTTNRIGRVVAAPTGTSAAATPSGRPVENESVIIEAGGGNSISYKVSRAPEAGRIAVKIEGTEPAVISILRLSGVTLRPAPADLFMRPDGFSKFGSAQAMLDELLMRQRTQRRGGYQGRPMDFDSRRDNPLSSDRY